METVLFYLIPAILGLLISYVFLRWTFGIDKRIDQNDKIIALLTAIAKNRGVTEQEIKKTAIDSEEDPLRKALREKKENENN